jgi:hypothetical protein
MRSFGALCVLLGLHLVVGCDEKTSMTAASTTPSANAPSTVEPVVAAPPPAADVVLDSYLKDLKCTKKTTADSCRLLQEFSEAKRCNITLPSGEGRWVGYAFVREKGVEKKQLMILWAKRMPTAQVSPGALPLKFGTGTLEADVTEHGFKMVRALSQGDQPSKHNQARPRVEAFVPTTQRGAVQTEGMSIRLVSEETVYLRQSGRKLILFAPNTSPGATVGDGTYAEFWSSSW